MGAIVPKFTDYSLDYHRVDTFCRKNNVMFLLLSIPFNTRPSIILQLKRILTHVYRQILFYELDKINVLSGDVINKIVHYLTDY